MCKYMVFFIAQRCEAKSGTTPNNLVGTIIPDHHSIDYVVRIPVVYTVFMLIERKQKNNFKSGLRTIRVKTIPGSEFSCVN